MQNRCALYVRVSSDRSTVENQLPELQRLAQQRGLQVVAVYEEVQSAAKARPHFDRMVKDAHAGRFDVLLVWSLDRLGRSLVGNLQVVVELDRIGVEAVSVREPWLDTSGPIRSLLIAIFSWCAEQERLRLIERTVAGMQRARREGKRIGRPGVQVDLDRARALRAEGKSIREVALALGIGASTLHRALGDRRCA